jgi:hypothetical protein
MRGIKSWRNSLKSDALSGTGIGGGLFRTMGCRDFPQLLEFPWDIASSIAHLLLAANGGQTRWLERQRSRK